MPSIVCPKCHKKTDDMLFAVKYTCGHQEKVCMDCTEDTGQNSKCPNCQNASREPIAKIPAKDSKSCFKCSGAIDSSNKSSFQEIKFKSCKTNIHSVLICRECFRQKYESLVQEEGRKKRCFLCFSDFQKSNMLYYSENLDCKGDHKVNLCGKCHQIFNKVTKRCPKCEEFKIDQSLCVACYHPIEDKVTILPIKCDSTSHKFSICMNCATNLSMPKLVCRLCSNKPAAYYSYFQTCETNVNELCLPAIKFISNDLSPEVFEVDDSTCPACEPISINYELVINGDSQEDDEIWLPAFSSVGKLGQNFIVSGGCDLESYTSLASSYLIKFIQEGSFHHYKAGLMPFPLNKARNSHSSYYSEKEKTLYVFGGAQKTAKNQITYLDSFECMPVLDDSINFNGDAEWQMCEFKLKKARCSASTVVFGNRLYIFGGFSAVSTKENAIEYLDLINKNVVLVNLSQTWEIPIKPVLKVQEDSILILGGFLNNQSQNDKVTKFYPKQEKVEVQPNTDIATHGILNSIQAFDHFMLFGGIQSSIPMSSQIKLRVKSLKSGQEFNNTLNFGRLLNAESTRLCMEFFDSAQVEFNLDN
jgi:hypothetical protein